MEESGEKLQWQRRTIFESGDDPCRRTTGITGRGADVFERSKPRAFPAPVHAGVMYRWLSCEVAEHNQQDCNRHSDNDPNHDILPHESKTANSDGGARKCWLFFAYPRYWT